MSQTTKINTAERKRSAKHSPAREMLHVVQELEAVANMKKDPGEYGDHRLYQFVSKVVEMLHDKFQCKVSAYIYGKKYVDGLNLAWIQVKRRRFYILASFGKSTSVEARLKAHDKMMTLADKVIPRLRKDEKCIVPEGGRIIGRNLDVEGAFFQVKVEQAAAVIEERLKPLARSKPAEPKERKRHGRRNS